MAKTKFKQMTLKKQLRDPVYRKWFATPPLEVTEAATSPPWFVYVQQEKGGPWRRAEVSTWKEGYRYIARNINKFHDMALSHKRREFRPPVVRDPLSGRRKYHLVEAPGGHLWCTFCRRMTRFGYFQRHHAMPVWANGGDRRCTICGVRLLFIKRYG